MTVNKPAPAFADIPLSTADAVAILRWSAAGYNDEALDSDAYRQAVAEVMALEADADGRLDHTDVLAAIRSHVPESGSVVGGRAMFSDGTGWLADTWTLEEAIEMAREPGTQCAWADGLPAYDLQVTDADGQVTRFSAFCPERVADKPNRREQILAEIAGFRDEKEQGEQS